MNKKQYFFLFLSRLLFELVRIPYKLAGLWSLNVLVNSQ